MHENMVSKMSKSVYIIGTSLGLGIGAYAAYRYLKSKESKCIDEGFEDVTKLEDNPIKRVLVLGLENSGKSTLIDRLAKEPENRDVIKPTEGFIVTQMDHDDIVYNIWEIGGRESVRRYWSNFLQDTDVLVFVVDASDVHNLPLAVKEIKTLLGDERLSHVPVVVVASKKDVAGAMSDVEVGDAIDVHSIETYKHKVQVIGTKVNVADAVNDKSIDLLKKAIIKMSLH